ncbi:MAG: dimethyl sulfoxide reductase anchor subunit [Betaproteobacteria bacterium]|nr:dimethyl sulfoxide reductase anchor subunit [Betaproteobacteria bacterium]
MLKVGVDKQGLAFIEASCGGGCQSHAPAFKARPNEPAYALLPPSNGVKVNQYGKSIQLVDENDPLAGQSLNINNSPAVSSNPNRYQQHGFHFTADNCIGCHACEAACSEKNALPAHISFRSVGYVEGGTYPDFRRVNISMACNHCDDPVCLKGCPTRAYTKFAEYGAVLQDPDICFGCGYCTWVCPYNAPQLDPIKGEVSKCNMCVDRLEVGLKPACVSACLAGALDFGVVETAPENRVQNKLAIPGFPDPEITHPNIRFQQVRELPREMRRTDSMPLLYVKKEEAGKIRYQPQVAARPRGITAGKTSGREWSFEKLRSREDPLVIFTLISQCVIGSFLTLFLGPVIGLEVLSVNAHPTAHMALLSGLLALETFALVISTAHLGKPHRFYRAFNNLRYSPVSREVAGIAVFYNALGLYTLLSAVPGLFSRPLPHELISGLQVFSGWLAAASGPVALYAMYRIYRIKARPYWDHWQVATSFYGSMLALGPLAVALVYAGVLVHQGQAFSGLLAVLAWPIALGLSMEGLGLIAHARDLERRGGEAAASRMEQRTRFGKTYILRNTGLALAIALVGALGVTHADGAAGFWVWALAALLIVATALIGRALFYVLVIPTTMPGAFFWRNQGFEQHARETGLARMPQVGVLPDAH